MPTTRPVMKLRWKLVECGQVGITGDRGQGGRGRIGQSQDGLYPDNRTLRSRIHASTLNPARIPAESLDRRCLGRLARAGQDREDDLWLQCARRRHGWKRVAPPTLSFNSAEHSRTEPGRKSPRMLRTYEFKISDQARAAPAAPQLGPPESSSGTSQDRLRPAPCPQPQRLPQHH